jgi:hypothetical protein
MNVRTAVSEIRRMLGRPNIAELGDADILMELWQSITYYRSVLNLSQEVWQMKTKLINVDAGTTRAKPLGISDFGSAIFVTTHDETLNPYFIERTINVIRPDQMSMHWNGPTNLEMGGGWYGGHVANFFSIINEGGVWKIMWAPAHQESATYKLWYTTGAASSPPLLGDEVNFPVEESSWLIVAKTTLNLFGHITDEDIGPTPKQSLLMETAKSKVEDLSPILNARRWDGPRRETTQRRKMFGQSRSGGGGFF